MEEDDELAGLTFAEFSERCPVAAREVMRQVVPVLTYIIERQPETIEKWAMAYAVGCPFCANHSMAKIAARFGKSKALLSHKANSICQALGFPPSAFMKKEETAKRSKTARNNHCNDNRNTTNHRAGNQQTPPGRSIVSRPNQGQRQ